MTRTHTINNLFFIDQKNNPEFIIAVTLYLDTDVFLLPVPARHSHLAREIYDLGLDPNQYRQGFLTSWGRIIDRKEAAEVSLASGQVKKLESPPFLFSEDIWGTPDHLKYLLDEDSFASLKVLDLDSMTKDELIRFLQVQEHLLMSLTFHIERLRAENVDANNMNVQRRNG